MTTTVPVSIVIPVRNEARTLPALLDALASQSVKPAELAVIDTGSTDGSLDMVNAWWRREQWRDGSLLALSSPGAYPGGARNTGIERATQPWIAFLDAADEQSEKPSEQPSDPRKNGHRVLPLPVGDRISAIKVRRCRCHS